eukprot:134462_1
MTKKNTFKIINYYGNDKKKLKKKDFIECDICITTTATFSNSMGKFQKMYDDYESKFWYKIEKESILFKLENNFFDRIVIDESHQIKNTGSKQSNAICTFAKRCKYKWCLTGTPISNDLPVDLSGMCRYLGIKYNKYCQSLKITESEKKKHVKLPKKFNKNKAKGPSKAYWLDLDNEFCINKIKTFIKPLMLRRIKKECLNDGFVEKENIIIKFKLNEEEDIIYKKNLNEANIQYKEFKNRKSVKRNYMHLLRMITKLRQICDHPSIVFNKLLLQQNKNDNNNNNN